MYHLILYSGSSAWKLRIVFVLKKAHKLVYGTSGAAPLIRPGEVRVQEGTKALLLFF
jgi:hypothetical protein